MRSANGGAATHVGTVVTGSDLLPRVASSIGLIAIAAVGAWWGGLATAAVVALAAIVVHLEWTGVTEGRLTAALGFTAGIGAAVLIAGTRYFEASLAVAGVTTLAAVIARPRPWRAAGVVYVSAFGLSLVALRESDDGLGAIAFLLAVVAGTDIGAYFFGRGFGGPKLWPAVSPKKTWAGAVGGLGAAVVAGIAAGALIGVQVGPGLVGLIVVLSVASQCGDLFESFVKRWFGAKDAGSIIPGHGGMMDRVDGLVFAAPVAVFIGFLHSGGSDAARGLIWW